MKQTLLVLSCLLLFTNSFGQQIDTLKVIVLSPYKIEVTNEYLTEYNTLKKEIVAQRIVLKKQKTKDKEEHKEEYNNQPDYSKIMFENELNFYDNLTIDNYVSMMVREYIAYRLYKPFKIKPRIVLVSSENTSSDVNNYSNIAKGKQNLFIINFPNMKFYKENRNLKVKTNIELYSSKTNEILLSRENIGAAEVGLTDYPMCSGANWDCAIVNSVYPSLFDILKLITSNNPEGK